MDWNSAQPSRSMPKVKPILRKFAQNEKSSLDLNRPAMEQGLGLYMSDAGTGSRSAHDASSFKPGGYHNRSTSGTSQFSTATTGSGQRTGSFVHPFQQTPRPYTPPLIPSYQGSLIGSEYSSRESPTLPEDEQESRHPTIRSASNLSNRTTSLSTPTGTVLPPLRIPKSPSSSRLNSQSNLHSASLNPLSADLGSSIDTISPSSAVRSSIDKGFRIRSRSELPPHIRNESIRELRRKFEEKEQAKAERDAQAEVKAIERRNLREARLKEKIHRKPTASDGTRLKPSKPEINVPLEKQVGFVGWDFNNIPIQPTSNAAEGSVDPPRHGRTGASTTRKKTRSAWASFMMWLRTRLLRIGRRARKE